ACVRKGAASTWTNSLRKSSIAPYPNPSRRLIQRGWSFRQGQPSPTDRLALLIAAAAAVLAVEPPRRRYRLTRTVGLRHHCGMHPVGLTWNFISISFIKGWQRPVLLRSLKSSTMESFQVLSPFTLASIGYLSYAALAPSSSPRNISAWALL